MWRDTIHPLLWLAVVGLILAFAIAYSIPPAGAAPVVSGFDYAENHAAEVCSDLDEDPTVAGVYRVLTDVMTAGLSEYAAHEAVARSVAFVCPHHQPLVKRFIAYYQTHPTGVLA